MKKLSLTLLSLLVLSACAAQPTLQEKLAGKSPAERKAVLLDACLSEAHYKTSRPHNSKAHKRHLKVLCEEMAKEMK